MIDEYVISKNEFDISRHFLDNERNLIYKRKKGECPNVNTVYIGSGGEVIPCWYIIRNMPVFGNAIEKILWKSEILLNINNLEKNVK